MSKKALDDSTEELEKETPAVEVEEPKKVLAYVGPTIVGIAVQYTIFNNGISNELQKAITANPTLGGLVVPVEQLPQAMESINKKEGALHILFEKSIEFMKGE